MLKKLGLIALSSLLVLPAISSATEEDYRIGVMPGVDHYGDDDTRKGLMFLDYGGTLRVDEMFCDTQPCSIVFANRDTDEVLCSATYNNDQLTNSCTCFPVADYRYYNSENTNPFQQFNITFLGNSCGSDTPVDPDPEIPVDPETPESDNVLGSFGSTLQGLVGNLVSSFSGILPTLILIGFGVLVLFVFWGYVKHASVELFSMGKNRNKSLSYYQNEDINAMYKNRRGEFLADHNVDQNSSVDWHYSTDSEGNSHRSGFYSGRMVHQYKDRNGYWRNDWDAGYDDVKDAKDDQVDEEYFTDRNENSLDFGKKNFHKRVKRNFN